MKKLLSLLTVTILILAGCSNSGETEISYVIDADRVQDAELECWASAGRNTDWLTYAIGEYNSEFGTNLTLSCTDVSPSQAVGKVTPALAAGQELPEIVYFNDQDFYNVVKDYPDAFVDLTEYGLGEDFESQFADKKVEILKSIPENGDLYGFPQVFSPLAVYYRDDLFKQVGIDYEQDIKSIEDLYEAGVKIYEETGIQMLGLKAPVDADFWKILLELQGRFFYEDGAINFTSDAAINAGKIIVQLMSNPAVSTFITGDLQPATQYDSSIVLAGIWWGGNLKADNPDQAGIWKTAVVPPFKEGGEIDTPLDGGGALYVSTSSNQAQAALQFLEWAFTTPEIVAQGIVDGLMGSNLAAYDLDIVAQPDEFFSGQVVTDIYRDSFNYINDESFVIPRQDIIAPVEVELGKVVAGEETVEEALANAEVQVENTVELPE